MSVKRPKAEVGYLTLTKPLMDTSWEIGFQTGEEKKTNSPLRDSPDLRV
jgi:hypothetical protein